MKINGLPVRDAHRAAVFVISKSDVSRAKSKAPDACAAALACQREFHTKEVYVFVSRVYVRMGDHWLRFKTPTSLAREIVALDRGGAFYPGEYKLSSTTESMALGVKHSKKRKPRTYTPQHKTENIRTGAPRSRGGSM